MAKFQIGDRVRMISTGSYVPQGELGTVMELHQSPEVKWDNYISDRGGNIWAVWEGKLELEEQRPEKLILQEPNYEIY